MGVLAGNGPGRPKARKQAPRMERFGARWLAVAALTAALLPQASCRGRRPAADVLAELAACSEQMAAALAKASSLDDLKAEEETLRSLAGRMERLGAEARRAGRASDEELKKWAGRIEAALAAIARTLAEWSRQDRQDMLEFVDALKVRRAEAGVATPEAGGR